MVDILGMSKALLLKAGKKELAFNEKCLTWSWTTSMSKCMMDVVWPFIEGRSGRIHPE